MKQTFTFLRVDPSGRVAETEMRRAEWLALAREVWGRWFSEPSPAAPLPAQDRISVVWGEP